MPDRKYRSKGGCYRKLGRRSLGIPWWKWPGKD